MIALGERLGIGIYTPAEAARYARVSQRIMRRWVFGEGRANPVIERQIRDTSEKVVTFLDFIQTLAVREVRNRHGVSLQKIRHGVDEARHRYGIDYPLARRHTIYLFGDQKGQGHGEIVIRLPDVDGPDDERFIQLTGRYQGNLMMPTVIERFLKDLQFDPDSRLASQYSPMAYGDASIVLNPHRRFGEPIVDPGGYTAETLWHATNTEGGIKAAAEAFGVTIDEVKLANDYFDSLLID